MCVSRCMPRDVINMYLFKIGYTLGNKSQIGRLISLSAMWYWSQIRRVGFKHEVFQTHMWQHLIETAIFKGRHAPNA